MGIAALILKLMPSSPESDLEEIKKHAQKELHNLGAKNISFDIQPVAFGLKTMFIKMAWPEEKSIDLAENVIAQIPQVSSVAIEDYRRAFG